MSYIFDATCPLCGSPAQFQGLDYGRQKRYQCPVCVEFIIEDSSEKRLAEMPQEFREKHSAHAKGSNATRTWVIREPTRAELAVDRTLTMVGKFVGE
jgi:uncharacterized Zn finger protein (UPF0148 family)